jgi:predicted helicase
MDAVLSDFRQKLNREDIVIRFYEDFLAAYKPQMRERRGVYYTPEPVVSYVVRSVDALVREKFGKPLGLADPSVVMLDPACGTGTFLLALVQLVRGRFEEEKEVIREITEVPDLEWSGYVQQFLLPRVYGFELLMAPYAVAHLKLGLFLAESGYGFEGGQRLNVFLMNTLDDLSRDLDGDQLALDIPQMEQVIATEAAKGLRTRDQEPVMIVIGNPPYSGHSANSGEWIGGILRDYYQVDGQPLGEKNPKWLQDDYVKFIRFGQWRIQQTGHGILAFVTNHGYLDNPTFRGMRQSLQGTFDWIRVLDLHGNSKKKEKAPDGSKDENVFDIQQGVSICLMVKEVQKD